MTKDDNYAFLFFLKETLSGVNWLKIDTMVEIYVFDHAQMNNSNNKNIHSLITT